MDKASIARLLRYSWEAVDAIVARVVVDHIDDSRLDHLYRIGSCTRMKEIRSGS